MIRTILALILSLMYFSHSFAWDNLKGIKDFKLDVDHQGDCEGKKFDKEISTSIKYLLANSKINLVHRRDDFRAAQHTVGLARDLEKEGKVEILTCYQPLDFKGDESIKTVEVKHDDGQQKNIEVDSVLAFFGLKMELGPIAHWGLDLEAKSLKVNTENFETNEKGIFAIGDICTYPGKLKLILSGFHEGALCAQECFKRAKPDEKYVFRFTTSSSDIQKRLGVK